MMNIIGRLTRNAEVRTVQGDRQVVSFSVAVNDGYKNKQGEWVERAEFFECSYWISPNVAQWLTKGTLVELSGRVSARAWQGMDGEIHAGLNFLTSQIRLLAKSGQAETSQKKEAKPKPKPKPKKQEQATIPELQDDLPF